MLTTTLQYIFKYIIFAIIIYLLITYIPKEPIKNPHYTIIFGIILSSLIFFDIIINYNKIINSCSNMNNRISKLILKKKINNNIIPLTTCSNTCSMNIIETFSSPAVVLGNYGDEPWGTKFDKITSPLNMIYELLDKKSKWIWNSVTQIDVNILKFSKDFSVPNNNSKINIYLYTKGEMLVYLNNTRTTYSDDKEQIVYINPTLNKGNNNITVYIKNSTNIGFICTIKHEKSTLIYSDESWKCELEYNENLKRSPSSVVNNIETNNILTKQISDKYKLLDCTKECDMNDNCIGVVHDINTNKCYLKSNQIISDNLVLNNNVNYYKKYSIYKKINDKENTDKKVIEKLENTDKKVIEKLENTDKENTDKKVIEKLENTNKENTDKKVIEKLENTDKENTDKKVIEKLENTNKENTDKKVIEKFENTDKENINKLVIEKLENTNKDDDIMNYTELPHKMHQPLGSKEDINNWSNMYTYLNTDKWTVPTRQPPVCIKEANCEPCPVYMSSVGMNVLEFPGPRLINQKINMNYIRDKINK
jgi:hypothetical protein